ncbi:hypothetical protein Pfo_024684 [Paulownia fortunei]|nr:hypothetical protein Pfo_024684 [Paulownia fortunei]
MERRAQVFSIDGAISIEAKKELSSQKTLKRGSGIVQWDEDKWFENTCCFSVVSNHNDPKFGAWEIGFNVLYGEKMDSKARMAVIGRVCINISEIAWKMENSSVEQKLHLSLQIDGFASEATLTVLFNFAEIRDSQDTVAISRGSEYKENVKARRRSLSQEEVSLDESDESSAFEAKDAGQTSLSTESRSAVVSGTVLDSDKKLGWFSWKSRRFSFKRAKTKEEKFDEKTESCSNENKIDADPQCTVSSSVDSFSDRASQKDDPTKPCLESEYQDNTTGAWEEKELISRDGQAKLKAPVFFASFDQRSDKAAGESACTALVAVISHWLHSNSDAMPNRLELDNLIMQGSSEWRKLCEDVAYVNDFPNKHFDLETVVRADIRPISIYQNKSFVGFFGAETFDSLKGAMSFDDIWNEISSNVAADDSAPRIYVVSWNDHFFVLKAEANAYYIIDTLGERLFEGCHQAYILRFDDKAQMQKLAGKEKAGQPKTEASENINSEEEKEEEEIICRGKECCREFIKRFLAAIPLKELEEEEKKKAVSYFSLHHRLQIEFNYSCSSSPPPSFTSSPLSSLTTSASSPFSE